MNTFISKKQFEHQKGGDNCKYNLGDRVSISEKTLRFKDPFRDEFVKFKAGIISQILPKTVYGITEVCLYEVTFRDGSIATEVPEYELRKSIEIVSEVSSPLSPTTSDIGVMTETSLLQNSLVQTPLSPRQSDSKSDTLTLIALNVLRESLRDSLKPKLVYTPLESPYLKQEIQNIGNDENLQNEVSEYFHKKTIKWIAKEHEFARAKKHLNFLKSKRGLPYIKKILKSFVKKYNKNWYELRDDETYDDVQEYIRTKLISL
jgi:hypothetical protein